MPDEEGAEEEFKGGREGILTAKGFEKGDGPSGLPAVVMKEGHLKDEVLVFGVLIERLLIEDEGFVRAFEILQGLSDPEGPISGFGLGDEGFAEGAQSRFVLFLFEKTMSEESVDRAVIGTESDRFEEVFTGLLEVLFFEVGEAQILVGAEEGGEGGEDFFVVGDGLVEFILFGEDIGEVELDGGRRIEELAGLEGLDGLAALSFGHQVLHFDEEAAFLGTEDWFDVGVDAVGAVEFPLEHFAFPVVGREGESCGLRAGGEECREGKGEQEASHGFLRT